MMAVVLVLTSCSDNFGDINTDPNNPSKVSPNLLLPVAQNYSAFAQERNRGNNTLGNMMMYNWSQSDGFSWYTDEFLYLVTSSFYQQNFDYVYTNVLKQYNSLSTLQGDENGYYKAIGNIMKAYHFNILVDTYGDIPYSEALARGGDPTPAYDNAQTIYDDLVVQLSAAIALIDATESNTNIKALIPGADDGIFGGDMLMWKKFANSIKLRMLVRQSSMTGRAAYIQTQLAAITTEGSGYITNDVEVNIGYKASTNQQNPKWDAFGYDVSGTITNNNNATCATDYILDYLTNTNDPRIDYIYEKPATGHLGVMQGLQNYDETVNGVDGLTPEFVSNIGPGILKSASQGAVLYTAAESYFNQAEIDLKFNGGANAKTLYESGIQASFTYLGAGNATTYFSQAKNLVNWNTSTNKLQAIITQKWIAVNGIDAIQSWFDYNRTGYPANLPISALATSANRPVRLAYPASEVTSNGLNLPAQPNAFTAKIFWAN
ncbi:SusD/RagB family nutrient-binding outer membrane lipoprotein [Flavobacterium acetivorans]|uniref:SusD/RagB family nutrient-binding outer membrane lipoprotein n=1 Tax=Flavobacterium acetivorans TaxID=2893883 RepID=UPI001E6228B1|nr:SusD/RagB family nutrient-binding outer membrane lipoprotein [Flavobacterium sp. F-29]UFH35821.1 SusD/RagB family nutrient-binding outer membrane lipoprotein [Flavobacterium sp. F-29]